MREGLQAVGQAGKARARTAGSVVGADGRDTARAQARASMPRGRRRKRERQRGLALGRECGPHNAGASKRANRQVGGRERHRSSANDTTHHSDTVKGVDKATNSDAFGITSWLGWTGGTKVKKAKG